MRTLVADNGDDKQKHVLNADGEPSQYTLNIVDANLLSHAGIKSRLSRSSAHVPMPPDTTRVRPCIAHAAHLVANAVPTGGDAKPAADNGAVDDILEDSATSKT